MTEHQQDQQTTRVDDETELLELGAPPAAPETSSEPAGDSSAPAEAEDAGGSAATAGETDDAEAGTEPEDSDAPTRHDSSAGFGVVGKFTGARADYAAQQDAEVAE